jgi:hypothetical protein
MVHVRGVGGAVLVVVHGATFGGPANEIVHLAREAAGRRFVVAIPSEKGNAETRLLSAGIDVIPLDMVRLRRTRNPLFWLTFPVRFTWDVFRLRALARRERAVLVHGFGVNMQAAVAAKLSGTPLVWSLIDIGAPRIIRSASSVVLRVLHATVLLNGQAMAGAYPGMDPGADRAAVYYPPIDLEAFVHGEPGNHEGLSVGTIANLNPDKALDVLIDAASRVVGAVDATFEITGAEHATQRLLARDLKARAGTLPAGRIRFLGETTDVPGRLRRLDLFVISSRREGTTTTALEAMAMALPVVATNVGGIPELVVDGVTGLLVPADAPQDLADAILAMARDPARRIEMGKAGRRRVEEHFGLSRYLEVVGEAYDRALRNQ